jgi:hypothetical protein
MIAGAAQAFDPAMVNFKGGEVMSMRTHHPPDLVVANPQKMKPKGINITPFTSYQIKGSSHYGDIDCWRRFSEFLKFRTILFQRWPGLYIPPIPHKDANGKNDKKIVEERMFFLDRFMKETATLPYIYEAEEYKVFLLPGEGKQVEKELERLPNLTTSEQIQRLRINIPINENTTEIQIK